MSDNHPDDQFFTNDFGLVRSRLAITADEFVDALVSENERLREGLRSIAANTSSSLVAMMVRDILGADDAG